MRSLIGEAALAVYVDGCLCGELLCTPGESRALAAGFCLSEGWIEAADGLGELVVDVDDDGGAVRVALAHGRREPIARRPGPSGPPPSPDLRLARTPPLTDGPHFDPAAVRRRLDGLDALQPLRARTRAAHAAALYDAGMELLAVAEDVGRHNALDKAVGKLLLGGGLDRAVLLVLSSRISFEMLYKAARARVPVVAAISRPTALAVASARRLNMTLANPCGRDGLCVYCGEERFEGKMTKIKND